MAKKEDSGWRNRMDEVEEEVEDDFPQRAMQGKIPMATRESELIRDQANGATHIVRLSVQGRQFQ